MSLTAADADTPAGTRTSGRLAALRARLRDDGLDGFLVPHADAFQGEYQPAGEARLAWLTGFTGSAGFAVVLAQRAALFTDGRYLLQASHQTDSDAFEVVPIHEVSVANWLAREAPAAARLGYDPKLHTIRELERLNEAGRRRELSFVPLHQNPIDTLWQDRPAEPATPIEPHPISFAGREAADKLEECRRRLAEDGVDALLLPRCPGVAWLFNLRARDVPHLPIARIMALVPRSGRAVLFASPDRFTPEALEAIAPVADCIPADRLGTTLMERVAGGKVRLAAGDGSMWLKAEIEAAGAVLDTGSDPTERAQAVKSAAEMDGARAAHRRDGAAMTRFLAWFDREAPAGGLTEMDAAAQLAEERARAPEFVDLSFDTIAGAGPNGAIVHYRVDEASNRRIGPGLFLIDSGGQYRDGTTDVTRTLAVGAPDARMRRDFTLVLKGMLAISRLVFPKGTSGAQLDAFARQFLWAEGLDYAHGTGHGVGSFLSVHEGPQRLSKLGTAALEPGMILSNEPGCYREGEYGIRIENLLLVVERPVPESPTPFLGFETLTFVPIDRRLIEPALLTDAERAFLDTYHAETAARIGPLLQPPDADWLAAATAPL